MQKNRPLQKHGRSIYVIGHRLGQDMPVKTKDEAEAPSFVQGV
jgi:hypothetical protein